MIKLVAIDLDGTLLDVNKEITEANKLAIKEAEALGCKIVIATGRPFNGVKNIINELGLVNNTDFVIVYNGGKILNTGTNELVFSSCITGVEVKEVFDEALKHDSNIHAFRKNEEFVNQRPNIYSDVEIRINGLQDKIIDFSDIKESDEFIKTMIVDEQSKLDKIEKNLNPLLREKMTVVRSSKIFLEFLNPAVEKGLAILNLADYLGIKHSETMAIGDAGNDLSMIKSAAIGVAMSNASQICLDAANYITKNDNNNSGVAEAINKFVLKK